MPQHRLCRGCYFFTAVLIYIHKFFILFCLSAVSHASRLSSGYLTAAFARAAVVTCLDCVHVKSQSERISIALTAKCAYVVTYLSIYS